MFVSGQYCVGVSDGIKKSTIVIVGMGMFKLKELVKMKNKNEIWAEDIKAIRATFDQERRVGKGISTNNSRRRLHEVRHQVTQTLLKRCLQKT